MVEIKSPKKKPRCEETARKSGEDSSLKARLPKASFPGVPNTRPEIARES